MGKASQEETETTPQATRTALAPARPRASAAGTMIYPTFPAHLLVPTNLYPTFPYINLDIFAALCSLWDVSLLSSSVGITEINSCFTITYLSAFGFCQQWVAKPGLSGSPRAKCSCNPWASVTSPLKWCEINPIIIPRRKDFVKHDDESPSPRTYFQKAWK